MGLCGFGVAPCPKDGGEYLLRSLEVVEEIPYACTQRGVPFGWSTWAEYRDHIARQPRKLAPWEQTPPNVQQRRVRGGLALVERKGGQ